MDFDSPDVEKDFPGLYASGTSKKKDESDFSESDHDKVSRKDLLIGRRKDKKDKKSNYATLEGESSPEEELEPKSPSKSKKLKTFKFTSSKSKEKREKSREKEHQKINKDVKDTKEEKEKEKKKDKKEKDKKEKFKDKEKEKKDKKSKQIFISEEVLELGDVQPVFGVSVSLATERSRCHDGIDLPLVVRDCIDYLQDHGLRSEQIYKVDPIKTRLQHFRRLYNNREPCSTENLDISTACGLLKLYLKELPEPILTTDLIARFEEVASHSDVTQQENDLLLLIENLPSCNKMLLSWILLHFDCVTQNERHNKMNAQSLAMLLSPPLQMSHRLLVTLLCHCTNLFTTTKLLKYVPPINATSPKLPETSNDIDIELCKQESLLAQIHAEMNAGFVSKKREEQLWEVQRIITQLKRKLKSFERKSGKSMDDVVDCESMSTSTSYPQTMPDSIIQNYNNHKTKMSCSDDESVKTVTIISTETISNTETQSVLPETQYVKSTIEAYDSQVKKNVDEISSDEFDNADNLYVHETGILMLPDTHPDYLTLIRLQLENQELINWKLQLQSRISSESSEIYRLNKLLTLGHQQENMTTKPNIKSTLEDSTDIESITDHYIKENTLLEYKHQMLAKEIFEENKELLQLEVDLALQSFTF